MKIPRRFSNTTTLMSRKNLRMWSNIYFENSSWQPSTIFVYFRALPKQEVELKGDAAMTIQQAIRARLRIEPGRRVRTFGGWCRRDRVMLDGCEIGKIQTRRAPSRTEILTIATSGFVPGHNIDWLVLQASGLPRGSAVSRVDRSRSMMDRRFVFLRRNAGWGWLSQMIARVAD